ncbi:MAG: hypothetical protein H6835_18740 [Planctomycetes bacterium]|nr:hypothetical protein [Planctomycetota bacterium]
MKAAESAARWQLALAMLVAGASLLPAQLRAGGAAADRRQELLRQVAGDDPRGRAFAELLEIGAPAAAAIVAAIERGDAPPDSPQLARYLTVLGELGPEAIEAVGPLRRLAAYASGETQRRVLDCLLDLAPYLGQRAGFVLDEAQDLLQTVVAGDGEIELRRRCGETWFRSIQLDSSNRVGALATLSPEQLLATITSSPSPPFRIEATFVMLSHLERREVDSAALFEFGTKLLGQPATRPIVTTSSSSGWSLAYPCGPRDHRRCAAAILRMEPAPEHATKAHCYLLQHGLTHERWQAIEWLRGEDSALPAAEQDLRELADAPETEHQLRCEAITTLGLVRPLAEESRDVLRDLAEDSDKAIAVRARAALRQHDDRGR